MKTVMEPKKIMKMLDDETRKWHRHPLSGPPSGKGSITLSRRIHYFNFTLWHEEDEARRRDVSDAVIARVKRAIDGLNQNRNDSIELLDEWLYRKIGKIKMPAAARQNSETPGSMVDRLSIMSLKYYHMGLETRRKTSGKAHMEACRRKMNVLALQRKDLCKCLDEFLDDFINGKRYFKIYRQFKMYNDPKLNPALYKKTKK